MAATGAEMMVPAKDDLDRMLQTIEGSDRRCNLLEAFG